MKKIDYSKRGPLIKVEIAPGRFVKMYERDAIARGLVKKERPQAVNKMLVPDEEKSPITPPQPSPQEGREKKGKRKKADSVRDREVGGSIPPEQVDEEEITSATPSGEPITPDKDPSPNHQPSGEPLTPDPGQIPSPNLSPGERSTEEEEG